MHSWLGRLGKSLHQMHVADDVSSLCDYAVAVVAASPLCQYLSDSHEYEPSASPHAMPVAQT
jgi:hypothetical protein